MPTVCVTVCDCADHPVWFVLCLLCCATLPTVLTLVYCTHSGPLCSFCAVLNMSVFYVSVCVSGRRWWLVKVKNRWRLRMEAW